ncbi:unnamed protein product [Prunus brigantina]
MARNKVKLAWIVNDAARKSSFRKRKACLLKKMSEINTLCDVSAFIIVYGPDSDEPTVWPDRPLVEQLVARFQSIPELERWKKMMSQETYLKDRVAKMQEQIMKIFKKNNELNTNEILYQSIQKGKSLLAFEDNDLTDLVLSLEDRMKEIQKRINYFEKPNPSHPVRIPPEESGDQSENMSQIEGDFTESLFWYKDLGKQIGNTNGPTSSVRSDLGVPSTAYFGSLTHENEMGLPNWNFGGSNYDGSDLGLAMQIDNSEGQRYAGSDMGMSMVNYGGITSGIEMGFGMFPYNGNNVAGSTEDTGLATGGSMADKGGAGSRIEFPPGFLGGNKDGSDSGLPPGLFGGSIAGSVGLPYDVSKSGQNLFSSP